MTTEVLSPRPKDAKDSARDKWSRGHRVTQDHGHRGPSHAPSFDEEWENYAPRRVKAAEQPLDDFDTLRGMNEQEEARQIDGLRKLGRGLPKWLTEDPIDDGIDLYDEEDDETTPLDVDSPEYEAAYDELEALLDRHGIKGEDRAIAADAFRNDPDIQRKLLDQANGLKDDYLPTSFEEVDSANRLSARSLTDYQYEGKVEDDDGDYHVPHMSVRN